MEKRESRNRYTSEQKLEILREAAQPGVTVSEVCRRRGLAPSVFYRWRAVADNGSAKALKQDAHRRPKKDQAEARQEAELARLRAVIAEITAENLELKKRI
jgi:transposase